ncbi:hypothetical protein T11_10474 [Trichinella zimbabwensis]|uniref:Uncharacterized protein n=1 Tax=Trichinella zimbabwensis TaxID=268475 RepID=A0A0V1HE85_9BILA|nr:hypothetical protein T11_10474 [Trichinella zimbabwensis]
MSSLKREQGKRVSRAGSSRTDNMTTETNPPVDTGASNMNMKAMSIVYTSSLLPNHCQCNTRNLNQCFPNLGKLPKISHVSVHVTPVLSMHYMIHCQALTVKGLIPRSEEVMKNVITIKNELH